MRSYESVVVFNPSLSETQLKDELKKVEGILASNKALDIKVNNWGRKEIAYIVKKQKNGYFTVFNYNAPDHGIVKNLAGLLRIADNVLKFQTHRINTKVRKFKGNPRRSAQDSSLGDFAEDSDY